MTYETMQYLPAKRERLMKPLFGAAAAAAAVATLGLMVLGPAALSRTDAQVLASRAVPQATVDAPMLASRGVPQATEVAILPGTIQVIGKRTKTASAPSPYLPASYKPRG